MECRDPVVDGKKLPIIKGENKSTRPWVTKDLVGYLNVLNWRLIAKISFRIVPSRGERVR